MNKPLDPEHIANENAAEEVKKENSIPQEETVNLTEETTEVPVESEKPLEEKVETPVEEVETPVEEIEIPIEEVETPVEEIETPIEEVETPVEEIETPAKEVIEEDPVAEEPAVTEEPIVVEEFVEVISVEELDKLSKQDILDKLKEIVEEPLTDANRHLAESLKQAFYKLRRAENEEAKKLFMEAGGLEEEFVAAKDELEDDLKELLAQYREKKHAHTAEEDKIKEENLKLKKEIIEKIKNLIESKDDFYKVYNEFRDLQQQWKDIKLIPQTEVSALWKEYQHYTERFYDLVKINNEMRDYDFKKNLELKQVLCESVERLDNESDVISAFYQLQKFHQEWREIGPVSREYREEIWDRFKKASSIINKKHQQHFDSLRSLEQRNLEEKTALCEEIEGIDYTVLTSPKHWDEKNKHVLELQEKWKTIGFVPKKHNAKIFERFRAACDVFFAKKSEFYQSLKENRMANLARKIELCEQAEQLKDSTEWKETTDKLVALQKEWKSIGPVPYKHGDSIWKRFITACDYFFDQKNTHFSSQKTEEVENLKAKKEIIERIKAVDESLPPKEAMAELHQLMAEFRNIGFVPFREKDKIYKEYRNALDAHFDRLKVDGSQRRLESFRNNLADLGGKSKNKILSEREKLMRTYERLKGDIQTYENNIGFLSISSKGGNSLVKEMQRKIESLKEELILIEKKIEVIDQNLEEEK